MTKQIIMAYDQETKQKLEVTKIDFKQNKVWFSDIEEDWTALNCLILSIKTIKEQI